jgi:C-terminal processing protease CtpA/Prc
MKFLFMFVCSAVLAAASGPYVLADTVYFHDGSETKGIVVENYHNRIVLSTFEGEKQIDKSDIKDILYDRREQNLLKLGDFHEEKGNTRTAYSYYKKAYEINPGYKEARDKFIYIRSILLRNPERQLQAEMAKKQKLFSQSGKAYEPQLRITENISDVMLQEKTGISICMDRHMPKVLNVLPASPAARSGIKKSDVIFSVWGRLTGYMELESIVDMIINNPSPEIVLTIKRKISVPKVDKRSSDSGISLAIVEEGIVIKEIRGNSDAAKNGLIAGDVIIGINEEPTRYMPLNNAALNIETNFLSDKLKLDILRDISLWRKEV